MIYHLADIDRAANLILPLLDKHQVICFEGAMGAGKTTLIKSLCKLLGVTDEVQSPTFSIVNEYASSKGPVYHFDFYRIENEEEGFQIGLEDYLDSGKICLLEWSEKVPSFLPAEVVRVEIQILSEIEREVKIYEPAI